MQFRSSWLLFFLIFISGCVSDQPTLSEPPAQTTGAAASLDLLEQEIDSFVAQGALLSDEHYEGLAAQLDSFAQQAAPTDIQRVREKLAQLDPALRASPEGNQESQGTQCGTYGSFSALEHEITVLAGDQNLIGPDHFQKLSDALDCFEAQGISVAVLRDRLAPLSPAGEPPGGQPNPAEQADLAIFAQLPECSTQQLSLAPVDLEKIYEISPLGNIGPPGHTLPTVHMHWHISAGGTTTNTIPLRSPGLLYFISLSGPEELDNPDPKAADYWLTFALCRDVMVYFNHVKYLSPATKAALAGIPCEGASVNPSGLCTRRLSTPKQFAAGTEIGQVGHLQGNFDIGAYDYRKPLPYVNPASYGNLEAVGFGRPRLLYGICPLDLFPEPVRPQAYQKIKRTAEPRCGEIMLDIPGTLQGNWFAPGGRADLAWDTHLHFGPDFENPAESVIAVAGIISAPLEWHFTAANSGTVNRRFADVKPDGIYCYESSGERLLVQLTDETTLKIEKQNGVCSGAAGFSEPLNYYR